MEKIKGPSELIEISDTLDMFLNSQKEKLEKRLMVLSSISHDIGTPATKLKLRTALIEDKKLKEKLESDIDKMIDDSIIKNETIIIDTQSTDSVKGILEETNLSRLFFSFPIC